MKTNREQSAVRFQMFSARRTVDLKARRVEVNQGLDLDVWFSGLQFNGEESIEPLIPAYKSRS